MKVHEVIKMLSQFNIEEDIRFHCSISNSDEERGGASVCMGGDISIGFQDNVDPETGNDLEDGPPQILVLRIDGEETYYN